MAVTLKLFMNNRLITIKYKWVRKSNKAYSVAVCHKKLTWYILISFFMTFDMKIKSIRLINVILLNESRCVLNLVIVMIVVGVFDC